MLRFRVPKAGDRVCVIGHDIASEDEAYENFPEECHSYPGDSITSLDATEYADLFEAFVHAPFKEDFAGDRNNTSLALQVTLHCGDQVAKALLFGDREYPTVKQIFDVTEEHKRDEYVEWNTRPGGCARRRYCHHRQTRSTHEIRCGPCGIVEAIRQARRFPEAAMQSIAGHLSKKMLDHYSHVRMAAKRQAVEALDGGLIQPELSVELAAGKNN